MVQVERIINQLKVSFLPNKLFKIVIEVVNKPLLFFRAYENLKKKIKRKDGFGWIKLKG